MKPSILLLLLISFYFSQAQSVTNGKIPLVLDNFYQDNNYTFKPSALIDGDLGVNFNPSWNMVYPNHEIVVDLLDYQATVRKVRIFDGGGAGGLDTKLYLVRRDNGQEVYLGNYTGDGADVWDEFPAPSLFIASKLIIRGTAGPRYGNELEVIADYTPYTEPNYSRSKKPLGNMFGVNTFWWDLMKNDVAYSTSTMYQPKYDRLKQMGITMARFYIAQTQLQQDSAIWSFNPTISDFYTDEMVANCHADGIEPLLTIMGNPPFIYHTYPDPNPYDGFNPGEYASLVTYPNIPHRKEVMPYAVSAKLGFITAARYGRNPNIPTYLLETPRPAPVWYSPPNVIRTGLSTVNYIEIGNELEMGWPDSMSYMTGQMLGPFLSAIYDGHMGMMGPGYGIKTADPTMKVVVPGFARAATDGYRGIVDWSRKNRGLNPDGTVNLPFDVINYHKYSTDGELDQYGATFMGLPPELSGVLNIADEFIHFSNKYASGKEVWLTEWGYDYHPQSTFRAPAIGGHSSFEVIGDWAIRSILTYAARGIDRMDWFKLYDNYASNGTVSQTQFNSMSLLKDEFRESNGANTNPNYEPRIVGDYFAQMKGLHAYYFDSYVSNNTMKVLKFKKGNDELYAIWHVEDTAGAQASRVFTEVTGSYPLSLPSNPIVKIKTLTPGSLVIDSVFMQVSGGVLNVPYSMKPVFVEVTSGFIPVPLKFTSFSASCPGDSVRLKWTTADETNFNHFLIQYSNDGSNWNDAGTTQANAYSLPAASYFRVIAIDNDNRRTYSRVVKADCNQATFRVYPNPVHDQLSIEIDLKQVSNTTVTINNGKGAMMYRKQEQLSAGIHELKIDLTRYAAGSYFLTIEQNGERKTVKVVKQ